MNTQRSPRIEDLAPGGRFKHYQLLERIGYGGQAVIWSAYDQTHNRVAAIRFDQASAFGGADPQSENQMFEQQARIIASLAHPHILPVYSYGVLGRLRFVEMPYLAGGSLRDWLQGGRLALSDSLKVVSDIVSALDYLHQRQIVHRDLKSTNVLLDCRRNVYLADFGLARVLSPSTQVLHTGHGTPPYAPPEQHLSSKLTAQSDLYSLGILFYELLTGELPWRGERSLGLQQINNPKDMLPDPRLLNPDVPLGLTAVLRSLTAADPADRPPSAAAALQLINRSLPREVTADLSSGPMPDAPTSPSAAAEAAELLSRGLATWTERSSAVYPLNRTNYVLIDAAYQADPATLPSDPTHCRFMLYGAILHCQRPAHWWAKVADPAQRISICTGLLAAQPAAALDGLGIIWAGDDASLRAWAASQPLAAWLPFLKAARELHVPQQMEGVLALVAQVAPAATGWSEVSFAADIDQWLGELALSQASYSAQALRLIGRVRSELAVRVLLGDSDALSRMRNLRHLSAVANSLPAVVPAPLRRRLLVAKLSHQLTTEAGALLQSYFLSFLGAALGFGGYAFWSYRLPSFMDTTRWLVALERGIFLGGFAGFGLFVIRAVIHRLLALSGRTRLLAGIGLGSLALLVAFLGYDVLFLDILPTGWLLPAGCLVLAAAFGLSAALVRPIWLRMACCAVGVTLAFTLTWGGHLLTSMTPLLFYEYTWLWPQVLAAALGVALPVAILGNWGPLEIEPGEF